jgi:hypothetical protein
MDLEQIECTFVTCGCASKTGMMSAALFCLRKMKIGQHF